MTYGTVGSGHVHT